MFTGIVEEVGEIKGVNRTASGICLKVQCPTLCSDVKLGDSIAVDGICLSVIDIKGSVLSFDVMQETLARTTLSDVKANDFVNLERSLRADSRIGGHFVSGHIDYKGRIEKILKGSEGVGFRIEMAPTFSKFLVEKGCVAIDGVSLTVAYVEKDSFTVYLIPHTLKVTTLGKKKEKESLNIETDLLAKYLAKTTKKTPSLKDLLKKYEYI